MLTGSIFTHAKERGFATLRVGVESVMTSRRRGFSGPWLLAGLLVILFGFSLSGCLFPGVESESGAVASDDQRAADQRETVYVNIRNFRFHPGDLEIAAGTRVVFVNEDDVEHNVVQTSTRRVGAEPPLFESPVLEQGDRWAFIFERAGEYPIICTVDAHQLMGMVGRIVVVDE